MEIREHIDALRREGGLLAGTAGKADLGARVPTCPDWTLRELVSHVGMVHRWATVYVRDGVTTMLTEDEERARLKPAPEDGALVDWYREGHAGLVAALERAPADLACWHFLPAPSPLAFWARRQAHEVAIHRVDAESAADGPITPFDPAFAVDGVNEMVSGFVLRAARRLLTERPMSLLLRASDTGDDWLIRIGAEAVDVSHGAGGGTADCTVRGTASDVYLLVWNRLHPDQADPDRAASVRPESDGLGSRRLEVEGDPAVLAHWRAKAQIRWS